MGNKAVIDVFTKIFATYNLLLIIASFILNPLVLFICLRSKKLRAISTFKLLALGSINDLMTVIGWNQESFTNAFFALYPYSRNVWYCRLVSVFIQFTSLSFESWMLVSVSLDRLLSMLVKKWTKQYFAGPRPYIYVILLWLVVAGLNFNEVLYGGHSSVVNGTEIVVCFETPPEQPIDWYHIMSQVFVYFGYITPLSLLVIINFLIILKATQFTRQQREAATTLSRSAKKKAQMTRTILVITFLYIAISIPGIVITGYLFGTIIVLEEGVMVVNMFNDILFSYPALNFFILFFSNRQFSDEAKSILLSRFRRNVVSSTHQSAPNPHNNKNSNTNHGVVHNTNVMINNLDATESSKK